MNVMKQKLINLRCRARDLQTSLRRWSLYDDAVSHEVKEDLLARMTPAEETAFESDLELTKTRLRPVSVQLKTVSRWFDFVLEQVNNQLDRAGTLLAQGRSGEAMSVLSDIEARIVSPNEETLGFAFRTLRQHTSHEFHQKLATINAIIRDLYLPTIKAAHQRGLLPKECLSRTPVAYITDVPEGAAAWHGHVQRAVAFGRRVPISLMSIPRCILAQPWDLVFLGHDVGASIYTEMDLAWEVTAKLRSEAVSAGVSPQTAPVWAQWHKTLFADVFATLKLGPAYVQGMIGLLGAHGPAVAAFSPGSSVPPPYLRWHVMLQALGLMKFGDPARELFAFTHREFGDPNQISTAWGASWTTMINDCRAVAGVLMLSPMQKLGGARLVDVVQPITAAEFSMAMKVKDLLLAGDESCSSDDSFAWAEPLHNTQTPSHIALAGLRAAFDATMDYETSRRLWIRFWCLTQYLTGNADQMREREDREFAPADAVLKQIALHSVQTPSVPAIGPMPLMPGIPGMSGIPMPAAMAAMS